MNLSNKVPENFVGKTLLIVVRILRMGAFNSAGASLEISLLK